MSFSPSERRVRGMLPGGVQDHRGILGVGLRLARIEIADPPQGQATQVDDVIARIPGALPGGGYDRDGLIYDHHHRA